MDNKKLRLALVGIGVVAIATLALTVTLWPEQKKAGGTHRDTLAANNSSGAMATADSKLATAAKPFLTNGPNSNIQGIANVGAKTPEGVVQAPPIKQEIGIAQVRDPKTGEMKDVPYTLTVMVMSGSDGKPLMTQGVNSMVSGSGVENNPYYYKNYGKNMQPGSRPAVSK